MSLIFSRKTFNDEYNDCYWEWNGIEVDPPNTSFEEWEVYTPERGFTAFDTVDQVKEYIKKETGKSGIVFPGLKDALKDIDTLEEEATELQDTMTTDGRYEEVGRFPSKSSPGEYYIVKMDSSTGDYTCNCKPWIYNKRKDRTCSHTDKLVGNKRETRYEEQVRARERAENEVLDMRKRVRRSEDAYRSGDGGLGPLPSSPKTAPITPKPSRTNADTKKTNPRKRRLMFDD